MTIVKLALILILMEVVKKYLIKLIYYHCYFNVLLNMNNIWANIRDHESFSSLYSFLRYHFISQIVVLAVIIVILIHYRGSQKNKSIANTFSLLISPLISKSFKKYDGELVYESPNIYKLYPSERDSCLFAIFSFALVPRQQIFSFLFNSLFFRNKDELVVQIPINNENPLSLTAVIVRRKQIKSITKKIFPDVKQLCKQYKPAVKQSEGQNSAKLNVPNTHCLLVEKSEHVRYFLYSQKQANLWKVHGKSVKLVYISDVNKFSRYPMAIRMVINLNAQDVTPMLEWLMNFVDRMSKAKMSIGERKQAEKKRQTLQISYD